MAVNRNILGDLPSITASGYVTNTVTTDAAAAYGAIQAPEWAVMPKVNNNLLMATRRVQPAVTKEDFNALFKEEEEVPNDLRRLVRVIIMDPDPRVPLEKCKLHDSGEFMTDLTDQELFYDIDLGAKLKAHNDYRVSLVDKTVKERTDWLEPVRIRDLCMSVTTVATFKK